MPVKTIDLTPRDKEQKKVVGSKEGCGCGHKYSVHEERPASTQMVTERKEEPKNVPVDSFKAIAPDSMRKEGFGITVSEVSLRSFEGNFRGGTVGAPDEDGFIDEADIPAASDDSEVWIRWRPGVARRKCIGGERRCVRRGLVSMDIVNEQTGRARLEFGELQITNEGTHTICISIPVIQVWTLDTYEKYYRWFDCCCYQFGTDWDCWVELEYSHDGDHQETEHREILGTIRRCDTDWARWTLENFMELIRSGLQGLGSSIGGGVGGAVGKELGKWAEEILKRVREQLGIPGGETDNGGSSGGGSPADTGSGN